MARSKNTDAAMPASGAPPAGAGGVWAASDVASVAPVASTTGAVGGGGGARRSSPKAAAAWANSGSASKVAAWLAPSVATARSRSDVSKVRLNCRCWATRAERSVTRATTSWTMTNVCRLLPDFLSRTRLYGTSIPVGSSMRPGSRDLRRFSYQRTGSTWTARASRANSATSGQPVTGTLGQASVTSGSMRTSKART